MHHLVLFRRLGMRWNLFALFLAFCWAVPSVNAQVLTEREAIRQLEELQVQFDDFSSPDKGKDKKLFVNLHSGVSNPAKALELLRQVKSVDGVRIDLRESKENEDCWKAIGKLSHLRNLEIATDQLPTKYMSTLVSLKELETLSLNFPGITESQAQELHALNSLKNLTRLVLVYKIISPKALTELKLALPRVKDHLFVKEPSLDFVEINPKDEPLAKLRKEKLNAAISGFNAHVKYIRDGRSNFSAFGFIESAKQIKNAGMELGDQKLVMETAKLYLDVMERAHQEAHVILKAGGGLRAPHEYYHIRYYYFDAQIHHLQVTRQLETK
jgi:hypothetical protein